MVEDLEITPEELSYESINKKYEETFYRKHKCLE